MHRRSTLIMITLISTLPLVLDNGFRIAIYISRGGYFFGVRSSPLLLVSFGLLLFACFSVRGRRIPRPNAQRPANVFRRVSSFSVDLYVNVLLCVSPITFFAVWLEAVRTKRLQWNFVRNAPMPTDMLILMCLLVSVIVLVVLYSLPLSEQKQSVGQLCAGIIIVAKDRKTTLVRSILRTLLGFVTVCLALYSVPYAMLRSDKRMWHDIPFGVFAWRTS